MCKIQRSGSVCTMLYYHVRFDTATHTTYQNKSEKLGEGSEEEAELN